MAKMTITVSEEQTASLNESVKNLKDLRLDAKPRDLVQAVINSMDGGSFEEKFLEDHMAKLKAAMSNRKKTRN